MAEIIDTWAEIREHIDKGDYKTRYALGNTKALKMRIDGKLTLVSMQIAAFDEDTLFDTGGKAPITWISKDILTTRTMNPIPLNKGGWMLSDMRKYYISLYDNILDEDVKELIKPVRKTSCHYETKSSHTTKDYCWMPSLFEIFGIKHNEETGANYTTLFHDNKAREKRDASGNILWWWLRSAAIDYDSYFYSVFLDGNSASNVATNKLGIVLGFCTSV